MNKNITIDEPTFSASKESALAFEQNIICSDNNEKLSLLWSQVDMAWSNYLLDYQTRIQTIRDIELMIDTFNSISEESKALQKKIMDQNPLNENGLPNQNYELSLISYLKLAKRLNKKDKYPIIQERLQTFYQNIITLCTLNDALHIKLNAFTKHYLTRE